MPTKATISKQGTHETPEGDKDLWAVTVEETDNNGNVVAVRGSNVVGTKAKARKFASTLADKPKGMKVTVHD